MVQPTLTQGVVMLQAGLTLKQFKEVVVALGAVDPMFKVVQHGIGVNVRRRTHHTCPDTRQDISRPMYSLRCGYFMYVCVCGCGCACGASRRCSRC